MPLPFFSPAGRLARAQKKIGRGKFEDATRMLVGMLNKGLEPELKPAVFLALAEAETGCGNLGNAGYYARQCEAALQDSAPDENAAETLARARAILAGP
ncbi:MAG: hypothetical protein HKN19_00555 [Halioglobus sp.]|nr:hypothetical protein [Halioglobus sp.]